MLTCALDATTLLRAHSTEESRDTTESLTPIEAPAMADAKRSAHTSPAPQIQSSIITRGEELMQLTRLHAALLNSSSEAETEALLAQHARGWIQLLYEAPTSSPCLALRQIPVFGCWIEHAFELRVGRRGRETLHLVVRTDHDSVHLRLSVRAMFRDGEGEYLEIFDKQRTSLDLGEVLEVDGSKLKALISFHPSREAGLHIVGINAGNTDDPIILGNQSIADIRIRYLCARVPFANG